MSSDFTWDLESEKWLLAEACRRSLWTFVQVGFGMKYWPTKGDEAPVLTRRLHKPICDWFEKHALQWVKTRKRTNLMILIPRFYAKTTLFTKAAQMWLHLQDPDFATYTGSESQTRSEEFLSSIGKVADGSDPYARFTWLYGNWCDKSREWRRNGLVTGARRSVARSEPSFGTWSVERGITGHHPDAGFLDDPISYESLSSHSNWFQIVNDHIASILPVFADNCLMVFVGTRYGDGDHLGTELANEFAASWTGMPCPYTTKDGKPIVRKDGKWHVYYLQARDAEGNPTFPERCGEQFLTEFERKHNLRYYAQMMNDPSRSEYNPLTMDRINQYWCDAKDVPWNLIRRIIITMDTAFKDQNKQARGDESVMEVWGLATGHEQGNAYYLEGHGSVVWRMEDFLDRLVALIQKYRRSGRHIILVDEEVGGKLGTWEYAIRAACNSKNMSMPAFIGLNRGMTKKLKRITEAAGFWQDGYVRLVRDAPGVHSLVREMIAIGNSKHDDWSDAAADVFNPKVYTPTGKIVKTDSAHEEARHIGDDILKPQARINYAKVYDDFWKPQEESPYDPV